MVAGMKQLLKWHIEAFDSCPIGDGYEVEVNEFDWKDENASATRTTGSRSATGGGRTPKTACRPTARTGTVCPSCGPATVVPTS